MIEKIFPVWTNDITRSFHTYLLLRSIPERCILEALLRRVLYCGHSTQYSHLVWLLNSVWNFQDIFTVICRIRMPTCRVQYFLLLSFFLFLAYSQPSQIGCLPYFHTWCGVSANLECTSEMCCMWLAENTGCKRIPKIRRMRTIVQLCRAVFLQIRQVLTIEKKTC